MNPLLIYPGIWGGGNKQRHIDVFNDLNPDFLPQQQKVDLIL